LISDKTISTLHAEQSFVPAYKRVEAVDLLRGLLMILMALDHTRDYFSNVTIDPTDPFASWPALFATRWVTHLCAPGFVALTGTSVFLQRRRGKSSNEIGRLLWTRGLWFLLLDATLISFAWSFTFRYPYLNIISTIGVSMVLLAPLQRMSPRVVGVLGAAIVLLHNLLDHVQGTMVGHLPNLWVVLHERGFLVLNGHRVAMVYFPVLAWFGIMCLGYAAGPLLTAPLPSRRTGALWTAGLFLSGFTVLRLLRGYGDTYRFAHLQTPAQTTMSFWQLQKYPPSLQYTLATLGILLLLFVAADAVVQRGWLLHTRHFLDVFGRVPFFFYVLHILLIHSAALVLSYAVHADWRFWIGPGNTWGDTVPANWGYGLPAVYAIWASVLAVLYLPCRWFSRLKQRRRDWWLSYL
jgi:uncharacterized membrane protein